MKDVLCFRKMITPFIIKTLFWVAVLVCVVVFAIDLSQGKLMNAGKVLILGPIAARVAAEILLVFFRIDATLVKIFQKERS